MISWAVDWFLSQGLVMILGFASKALTDFVTSQQHEADVVERTKLEEHNRQLEESVRIQARLADEAAKRVSDEDALRRLEGGSA
jgi:hypothetical protein